MYLPEAEATLLAHGIRISNVRYVLNAVPEGRVIGQTVPGGQTLTGYENALSIELVVSSGLPVTEPIPEEPLPSPQ
jgi:beta-lactam-binding protein with PASTA domain